ncbi:TEX30 protein, partial [Chunga burmeisteri]|nr:TEX30 protein [Chunga burmeisteri]
VKVKIPFGNKYLDAIFSVPEKKSTYGVILTHGAGGDMNFPHLVSLAAYLASRGVLCLRFTCKGLNVAYRTKAFKTVVEYLKLSDDYKLAGVFLAGIGFIIYNFLSGTASNDSVSRELYCYSAAVDKPDLRSSVILLLVLPPGSTSGFLQGVASKMKAPKKIHWIDKANHGMAVKGRTTDDVMEEINAQVFSWLKENIELEHK